ncbi:MAG: hypothetical protein BWX79_03249 [Alphaproteobacteria bacterium ADurb.Bin100]|nr:MAG: hypothetical protein BWX79_03249 [Alphaproteobacteria bacterium ADurb.Bin100]
MNRPEPVSAACRNRGVVSAGMATDIHHASVSRSRVTVAAVPIASVSVPRTAASRIGSANKGV